jgi:Protein of unknown function (DUF3551)
MRMVLIGLAAMLAAVVSGTAPASAQYWQGRGTWCIQPPQGTWDCSYYSFRQCQQSLSGRRGTCTQNPSAEWERRLGKKKKQQSY